MFIKKFLGLSLVALGVAAGCTDVPMTELNQAFQRLARVTYKTATSQIQDNERVEKIRDVIRKAAEEIEALSK